MKYRSKKISTIVADAFQMYLDVQYPDWIQTLISHRIINFKKFHPTLNRETIEVIVNNNTPIIIQEGIWIVQYDGNLKLYTPELFWERFEEVSEKAPIQLNIQDDVLTELDEVKVTEVPVKRTRVRKPKVVVTEDAN